MASSSTSQATADMEQEQEQQQPVIGIIGMGDVRPRPSWIAMPMIMKQHETNGAMGLTM